MATSNAPEQPPTRSVEEYRLDAAARLKAGAPLQAYDIAAEGTRAFPDDPRLRQLAALALARTGASRQANQILRALVAEGHVDEETVGMLARTYKDLWSESSNLDERRQYLEAAFTHYRDAYKAHQTEHYWTGINAATMALLLGNRDEAHALARDVQDVCHARRTGAEGNSYWLLATLGEASLVLGDIPAARDWYERAASLAGRRYGDLVSTRRNARLILQYEQLDPAPIEACFRIPRVAVFAGHLIDRPERSSPRFPAALEDDVRREIAARLQRHDVGLGFAAAAAGGDIVFLEAVEERGADAHIVLPYNRDQFLADSVDVVPGANWPERYHALLERAGAAQRLTTVSHQRMLGGAMSYRYGFLLLDGMAAVRADELDTDLICLALWDGREGDGAGGTAESIEHWHRVGRQIDVIDLTALRQRRLPDLVVPAVQPETRPLASSAESKFEPRIVGLIFADVFGFSKLTEEQMPRFIEHYLGTVARVLAGFHVQPILSNTWGDGLYFVFEEVRDTGNFALQLSETIRSTDWSLFDLPATLSLRTAVHAGPAFACIDPVTRRENYLGAHVSMAARIEPITPPGEVYASGHFAALARSIGVRDFVCGYVGQTPLAKAYGTIPMYIVHRPRPLA